MDVVVRVMMFRSMYESSRTYHVIYLSCMSLCIIMLELYFIRHIFFVISGFPGFLLLAFPQFILNVSQLSCVALGKT